MAPKVCIPLMMSHKMVIHDCPGFGHQIWDELPICRLKGEKFLVCLNKSNQNDAKSWRAGLFLLLVVVWMPEGAVPFKWLVSCVYEYVTVHDANEITFNHWRQLRGPHQESQPIGSTRCCSASRSPRNRNRPRLLRKQRDPTKLRIGFCGVLSIAYCLYCSK